MVKNVSLKKQLQADLKQAEKELQQLQKQLAEKPDFGPGTGNPVVQGWEMALARKEVVINQINSLQTALSQVEKGDYGYCENCGKPINPERLKILPTATLCVDCARNQ